MDKNDIGKMCENCRFFRPDVANMQQGKCQINAPVSIPVPQANGAIGFTSGHPPTLRNSWCGQYEALTLLH